LSELQKQLLNGTNHYMTVPKHRLDRVHGPRRWTGVHPLITACEVKILYLRNRKLFLYCYRNARGSLGEREIITGKTS
jgi:hypothetical protein